MKTPQAPDGRDIRIGSLANHVPFQDLVVLLEDWATAQSAALIDIEGDDKILKAHSRAKGATDAVAFIKATVGRLHRAHFTEGQSPSS